jgi:hypothetical protein
VGAIAGPALALVSLAWQASDRLRRLVLDVTLVFDTAQVRAAPDGGGGLRRWHHVAAVSGQARVINPRPSAVVVRRVQLQARNGARWWMPWRRPAVLGESTTLAQVPPHSDAMVHADCTSYHAPRDLRVVVSLNGRRRKLRAPWVPNAGAAAVARAAERNHREGSRRAGEAN